MTNPVARVVGALDASQRRRPWTGVPYAVIKKFSDDAANLYVVGLAWYGFTAIFPLLLVVVTVFGFLGVASLGTAVINTLHQFPVVGQDFNPSHSSILGGNPLALVVGILGLLYGAQGVTQTAEQAMATVWGVPPVDRPGFVPRLARSIGGLVGIGLAFLVNAPLAAYLTAAGRSLAIRVPAFAGLLIVNIALYLLSFVVLTTGRHIVRRLLTGAVLGGIVFTLLITVGTGLLTHVLRHASTTYGAFGSVIGLVTLLLLLAKLSLYAAELNVVLHHRLYPRALPAGGTPTAADRRALHDLVHLQRRSDDEAIGVGFGPHASEHAARDAAHHDVAGGHLP